MGDEWHDIGGALADDATKSGFIAGSNQLPVFDFNCALDGSVCSIT
jgi:hypothetical protein